MASYTFRLVEEADFPRIAELLNMVDREPTSVDDLRTWATNGPEDRIYLMARPRS